MRMYRHIIILQPVDGATVVAMGHRCSNRSHHFLSLSIGFFTSISKLRLPNGFKCYLNCCCCRNGNKVKEY